MGRSWSSRRGKPSHRFPLRWEVPKASRTTRAASAEELPWPPCDSSGLGPPIDDVGSSSWGPSCSSSQEPLCAEQENCHEDRHRAEARHRNLQKKGARKPLSFHRAEFRLARRTSERVPWRGTIETGGWHVSRKCSTPLVGSTGARSTGDRVRHSRGADSWRCCPRVSPMRARECTLMPGVHFVLWSRAAAALDTTTIRHVSRCAGHRCERGATRWIVGRAMGVRLFRAMCNRRLWRRHRRAHPWQFGPRR